MLLLIGQILRVNTNDLAALITGVGEHVLVALDAEGVVLPQHVPGHVPRHRHESRVMGPACARQGCRRSDGRRESRTRYPSPW